MRRLRALVLRPQPWDESAARSTSFSLSECKLKFVLRMRRIAAVGLLGLSCLVLFTLAAPAGVIHRDADCRPAPGSANVPPRTSFFIQLDIANASGAEHIRPESVGVQLAREHAAAIPLLLPGLDFANGASGTVVPAKGHWGEAGLAINIEAATALVSGATYVLDVTAETDQGAALGPGQRRWSFCTETAPAAGALTLALDLRDAPVTWHGGFFTGFCKPSFCTSAPQRIPGYELMAEARKEYPKAWSLQRDCFISSMDYRPAFLSMQPPNAVRERETRRITAMTADGTATRLELEDFFGHAQYGIPSGRPASDDYHPGDEVLIADGEHHALARVVSAATASITISPIDATPGYWKIAYEGPLPKVENPNAPGLFPPGGCYLRKFSPAGTPCYYWGRVDKEYDIVHGRFGKRLLVNFCEAPGDLSIDGGPYTTAKDYVELHEVTRVMTAHLLERYGDDCLDFVWSIFNEPDLSPVFWRCADWIQLQKFYDYSTDAILRAFEDKGYDSDRVFIGGLELGAIFGARGLRVHAFLAHCSPSATHEEALAYNAAFADPRLDGRRSRRVETLCRASGGRGAPCDFISIHAYERSQEAANKLITAKEIALAIDPRYYADLWVNTHESCLNWSGHPDAAVGDSYMGNGYFPTWCADVASRLLHRAAADPRYAYGESILTVWPWPNQNFTGMNAVTREIHVDDNGDGREDRTETVVMPIFHFLTLLSGMGERYWLLPEETEGGHVLSGFASRREEEIRLVLYAHNGADMESRSDKTFDVSLELAGTGWRGATMEEYRFDKAHNTYYELAKALAKRTTAGQAAAPEQLQRLEAMLNVSDASTQLEALSQLGALGTSAQSVVPAMAELAQRSDDPGVKAAAWGAVLRIGPQRALYTPAEVAEVREQSRLRTTRTSRVIAEGGSLPLRLTVSGNGINYVVLKR